MTRRAGFRPRAAGAVIAAVLSGCAAGPSPAPADPEALETVGPLVILERRPATGRIAGEAIFALAPGQRALRRFGGDAAADDPGEALVETIAPNDDHGATVARDRPGVSLEYRAKDAGGALVMPAILDRRNSVLTLFDPPLVIAPATLEAGVEHASEAAMRVVDARRTNRTRETGKATRTITYTADARLGTPYGTLDAKVVEIRFTADLRFADAFEESTLWVTEQHGVIAERHAQTVHVLGIPGPTREEVYVREERAEGPSD